MELPVKLADKEINDKLLSWLRSFINHVQTHKQQQAKRLKYCRSHFIKYTIIFDFEVFGIVGIEGCTEQDLNFLEAVKVYQKLNFLTPFSANQESSVLSIIKWLLCTAASKNCVDLVVNVEADEVNSNKKLGV